MPTVLDNFIVVFSQKGAENVRKSISEMEKMVSKSVQSTLKEIKARKKAEDSLLVDWLKAKNKREREIRRSGATEARIFEFVEKNKRKEVAKTVAEIERQEKARKAEKEKLDKKDKASEKEREIRRKKQIMYASMFDKIESAAAKAQEKQEKAAAKLTENNRKKEIMYASMFDKIQNEEAKKARKATKEKLAALKAWRKENGLEAKEKRLAVGREWLEQKKLNKERGRALAIKKATAKQEKIARDEAKEKAKQEREALRQEGSAALLRQRNIRKVAAFFGLSRGAMLAGGIGAGILGAGMLAKGTWDFTKDRLRTRARNALSYLGTGTTPENVQGIDKILYGYGGEKGEAMQLLSQLSAGIGAMRFGDTGLVQTLGTFGISGIGAQSKSKDVLRAVWQRAQGMTEEEQEAMFNALGFTGAMKGFMRKGTFDELEATAMVSEWKKTDKETLQGMYDVENTISKYVESIASGVGDLVRLFVWGWKKPSSLVASYTNANPSNEPAMINPVGGESYFSTVGAHLKELWRSGYWDWSAWNPMNARYRDVPRPTTNNTTNNETTYNFNYGSSYSNPYSGIPNDVNLNTGQ